MASVILVWAAVTSVMNCSSSGSLSGTSLVEVGSSEPVGDVESDIVGSGRELWYLLYTEDVGCWCTIVGGVRDL